MSSPIPPLPPTDVLFQVQKPGQYLGGELNSVVKEDNLGLIHFALAFPDTYEVGMSHLGLQILYQIINERNDTWAERVFMPFPDMEEQLHSKQLPLTALESKRPLSAFDVIGFSLQYELCATNLIAMLSLGQIPLFAAERSIDHPLVLGGGPYAYHPEPLAPFFDAFFLGDAEEAIHEIIDVVALAKAQSMSREVLLSEIAKVRGIYVPSKFQPESNQDGTLREILPLDKEKPRVTRRLLPSLENSPGLTKPVVPNIRTVHNRLSIEVMRGCVRGCRFCQAGYLYRPQRERSPQEILRIVEETLPVTGFEELSLLSLSTADYCSIVPLLKALMNRYGEGETLAVSFPSTRVDALTPEILEQVQRVRRTGFTVAPEAGTQRLRNVINKGVTDEEILATARNVFTMGWKGIKLYFMLGLPTETDEDLAGIIDIARRVQALSEARAKEITVSVSTHVPKPHTPFQWAAQITPEETLRRQRFLATGLARVGVNFRYHDAFSSLLEGVFARGGRELAAVIVRAYQLGCRLDAWAEYLNQDLWMQAFSEVNLNPYFYLRERKVDEVLPWDHLDCDIPKSYFEKEYRRAIRAQETADCLTQSCSVCGACNYDTQRNVLFSREDAEIELANKLEPSENESEAKEVKQRLRLRYLKRGVFSFIGHLEMAQTFHRAVRRAALPVVFSRGFHPLPRIVFGPPLPLGLSSRCEYVDLFLDTVISPEFAFQALSNVLPEDLRIESVFEISLNLAALQAGIVANTFRVTCFQPPAGLVLEWLKANSIALRDLPRSQLALPASVYSEVILERDGSNSTPRLKARLKPVRTFSLGQYVSSLALSREDDNFVIYFRLRQHQGLASPKIVDIVRRLIGLGLGECDIEKIETEFEDNIRPFPVEPIGASVSMIALG